MSCFIFLCCTLPSKTISSDINRIKKVIMEKNCSDTHIRYGISYVSHIKVFEDTITVLTYLLVMFTCFTSVLDWSMLELPILVKWFIGFC